MAEENGTQNPNSQTPPTDGAAPGAATEVQKLQEQADKYKNDFLYLRAEFENYKRNAIKERSDLIKYGGERLVRELLEIVDNFERALAVQVTPENLPTYKQGIEMTASEFKNLLQRHSITEVAAEGVPFDPAFHEALGAEPTDKMEAGHVLRVFKKPYKYHDKIIRTGQVVVARKPE